VPLQEWAIPGRELATPAATSPDRDAGSSLNWRFSDQDPFRFVNPKDVTIVDPPTGPRYVIELPDPMSNKTSTTKQDRSADAKSILADLDKDIHDRAPNLAEIPLVREQAEGAYHTGADGLHYLKDSSFEKPQAGAYHQGADGLNYLNGRKRARFRFRRWRFRCCVSLG